MEQQWNKEAVAKGEKFYSIFKGLPSAWGSIKNLCIKEPVTQETVMKHLEGTRSLGIYPIFEQELLLWASADFDFKAEVDRETLSLEKAREFGEVLFELGIKHYWLERSKSGLIHLWILFKEPVLAMKIRYIFKKIAARLGLKEVNGVFEIFPKQDRLEDGQYGNFMHLPYHGALNGGSHDRRTMINPDTELPISLNEFLAWVDQTRISSDELDAVFESLAEDEAQEEPTPEPGEEKKTYSETSWQDKREKIIKIISPYWVEPNRDALTYHLSDLLCRNHISETDAWRLILEVGKLCKDEELKKRRAVVRNTYAKREAGKKTNYKDLQLILSPEDYESLVNLFSRNAADEVKVITIADYVPTPRKWLIESAVPEAHTSLVYAEGGMAKSLFGEYISILAASGGRNLLGLSFPSEPKNVLYLDWEQDANEFSLRASALSASLENSRIPRNIQYCFPELSLPQFLPAIDGLIKRYDTHLLVIDSLGAAGVDPDKAVDVIRTFARLKTLGVTILILDHQPKMQSQDNYNLKTPYGSVYKYNLSRSVFQLSCINKQEGLLCMMLRHKKSNFGRLLDDLLFDISFEEGKISFSKSDTLSPELNTVIMIRDYMVELAEKGEKVNRKAILEGLNKIKGLSQSKIDAALDRWNGVYWDEDKGNKKERIFKPKA